MNRLLSINNYHYRRGGAEVIYLEQMKVFEGAGWQVAAMSMKHPRNEPSAWSDWFADGIEFGSQDGLVRKLRDAASIIYSRDAALKTRALIRHFRPQVAHAHNVYHHLSPSVLAAVRAEGVPLVMTLHDFKLLCPAYAMLRAGKICEDCRDGAIRRVVTNRCMKGSQALSALILVETKVHRMLDIYRRNVDRFIVPSHFYMEKFRDWGWSVERFSHVPNFVDLPAEPSATVGDAFLTVGRLSREKGLETFVRAVAATGVEGWIVGSGPEEASLHALAADLKARIRFFGFRSGHELWALVRACRAVVVPSQGYENSPMSILEAYAHGKPAIGSRVGGIPELIIPEVTGAIFEPGNVQDLADRLHGFAAASTSVVHGMGQAARELAEREFSASRYVENMTNAYRELGVPA